MTFFRSIFLTIGIIFLTFGSWSQVNCTGDTPFFSVDLTGSPAGVWTSPAVIRDGSCCGGGADQVNCIELSITLDPGAEGIIFNVESGANPGGALYYQVNCIGVPAASGSAPLCLNGVGPHLISYCKVGNNQNTYSITSVPAPSSSGDVITADGCTDTLTVMGVTQASVTWTSLSPGAPGQYNNYLNNLAGTQPGVSGTTYTGQTTVVVTPQPGYPPVIQYEVCGNVVGGCSVAAFCDTVSVSIFPNLFADAGPDLAICNGTVVGTPVVSTAIGGTFPFTYTWSGPGGFSEVNTHNNTTDTVTAMIAGTYIVVITDATGCPSATDTVTVLEYFVDIVADAGMDVVVCGTPVPTINLTGSVTATNTGVWSGGNGTYTDNTTDLTLAYTPSAGEIAAGSVTLTLTPTNHYGCPYTTDDVTITLTQFTSLLSAIPTNISCFGLTDGSIDLTITPGAPAYTTSSILWSNAAVTEDISGLGVNNYIVTVTDENGCTGTTSAAITEPTQLTSSITAQTNVSCFGGNNGSVTVAGANATPNYTYSLDGGPAQASGTFSGLTAGSYIVTVTDFNGCTVNQAVTITEPPILTQSITAFVYPSGTNISCFGLSDGSIDLTIGGGTAGYSYAWTPAAATEDLTNVPAGTYDVIVTDALGCQITSTITLTEPPILTEAISAFVYPSGTNISCFGLSDGSVDLTVGGGNPGYTYAWTPAAATEDLTNVPAGTYDVLVTDINGCVITSSITLVEPPILTEAISAFVYPSGTNISCFGLSDGSVDLTIGGGNPGYTYAWTPAAATEDLTNVPAGTYDVLVTDVNGCTITSSITLVEPPILTEAISAFVYPSGTNISCFGLSDGSVDLTIGGGNPGYTYTWTPAAATEDLTNVPAGTYDVLVTDVNGCTITSAITLTEPPILTEAISAFVYPSGTNISCFGLSDGSVDLTIGGGNPGYTYAWTPAAATEDLTNVPAGTYDVLVTDVNGCTITSSITLVEPPILTEAISAFVYPSGTNISCFGLSDGSVDLTIGGGNPGYTYAWTPAAATQDLTNVPAGTYDVLVTDINGCTITSNITLVEPAELTSSLTPSIYAGGFNLSGCLPDGSIDLTVFGGNPGFTYDWSNLETTEDLANLPAGFYSVTITDVNGCQTTSDITLTEPTPLTQTISAFVYPSGTNISCFGLSDGSIDLTIGGGTPGYTYAWTPAAATEDLTNVPAGTYDVLVTDANGCTITSTITLTEPPILTEAISAFVYPSGTNISCFGLSDGSVDLTVGGGNPGYTYAWTPAAATEDLTNVPAGTYDVLVTDINGCVITSSITLVEPPILTEAISAFVYPSGTNISCFGLSDGSVDLTIGGGNPGYTYAWTPAAATEDLTNVPAGTYDVLVTDVNGCTITSSITLVEPPILTEAISAFVYPSGTNISCFGFSDGSVDLTIGGGNPGYTYAWTPAAATEDLTNVPAGTYDVLVTDVNGCTITSAITLTEPPALTEAISAFVYPSGTNISCFGLSDGSVDLTIGGGNPGYTYAWTPAAATEDLTNVTAGIYDVLVTDINGCTITSSITLVEPPILTEAISAFVYPSGTNISCFGLSDGSVDLTIGGGNPGYTYAWTPAAATEDLTNVPAGTYDVLVTDVNGCTITSSITLVEPPILTEAISAFVYPSGTNISCFGLSDGSVDLTIGGGNPGYTYAWTPAAATEDLTNVPAGTYDVLVTDVNGCTITSSITLVEPPILTEAISAFVYPSGTNISCFGLSDGSVDLTIGGGNPGYTYAWTPAAATEDLTNIPAGTYDVLVTDVNGCTITSSITLIEPPILTEAISAFVYPSGTNISCFGLSDGSVDLTIGGGNPGYTYAWTPAAATEDLTNVPAGTYDVLVTDVNGCTITSSITLTEPPILTEAISAFVYPSGTNISCFGLSDGSVDLTIGGGNPGYTYAWTPAAATEDLTNVPAGTYDVLVTDVNGCTITSSITLVEPPILTEAISAFVYPSGTNISCFGLSDGSVDLTIGGGNPGYTYAWTPAAATEDLANVPAGIYDVLVTDINGCTITSNITLVEPPILTEAISAFVYPSGTNISCFGLSDGSVDLTIGGGNPGYTYAWTPAAATEDLTNVPAGTYDVLVTDVNGCTITSSITLVEPPILTEAISTITYPSGTNISCFGFSDGSVDLTIGGGNPGYTYTWTPAAATEDLINVPAGTYDVLVTDVNGCTITSAITLTEPPALVLSAVLSVYAGGYNLSGCAPDGSIDLSVVGGNPGYTYLWSNSAITQDIATLPNGPYSVTVTDINGCQTILDTILTQPITISSTTLVTTNYNGEDISCGGASDGGISVTAMDGVPAYTFVWTNSSGVVVSNLQSPNGLPADTYTISITDQNSCIGLNSVILTEPDPFVFDVIVSTDYNGQDISCFGFSDGGIDMNFTGGTPAYTIDWTNSLGATVSVLEDPQNLPAGQYFLLLTDVNGCTFTSNITLSEPPVLNGITSVTTDYNGQDISCFDETDGAVIVAPSGGTPGYSYNWTNSGGTTVGTNIDLINIGEGTYDLEIIDLNGCIFNTNIVVTQPTLLTSGTTIISNYFGQAVSCVGAMDGIVEANVNGGTPGYSYAWSTTPIQTTAQISNMGVGSYSVSVTDANGCTSISYVELNANPLPALGLPPVIYGCIGNDVQLDSQAEPGSSCMWIFSDGQVFNDCGPFLATFPDYGCYDMQLSVINAQGCINDTSMTDFVCIMPNPLAGFYADEYDVTNIQSGTNFWNTSMGADSYVWDFGDGSPNVNTTNAYHEFINSDDFNSTSYDVTLYAYTQYGCMDSAVRTVIISPDLIFYVPNAFTPDGDAYNNIFRPIFSSGYDTDNYGFMIFNRWGELIYETNIIGEGWDGTYNGLKVQEGVYTWKIKVKNSVSDRKEDHVGHVTLLRGAGM